MTPGVGGQVRSSCCCCCCCCCCWCKATNCTASCYRASLQPGAERGRTFMEAQWGKYQCGFSGNLGNKIQSMHSSLFFKFKIRSAKFFLETMLRTNHSWHTWHSPGVFAPAPCTRGAVVLGGLVVEDVEHEHRHTGHCHCHWRIDCRTFRVVRGSLTELFKNLQTVWSSMHWIWNMKKHSHFTFLYICDKLRQKIFTDIDIYCNILISTTLLKS